MNDTITREEWLAEMERVSALKRTDDEGWTSAEWAEKMGFARRTTNDALRAAHLAGRLKHGKRSVLAINGRRIQVDVYRLVPAPE